jgi:CheY-like chemotaxis protein
MTFTVTDSGIGITAADLKRLFRPFAQASEEVARRYGGAGLGLVFVKRIAKAMGGDLVVTSKPGRGSTFRLTVVMKDARLPCAGRAGVKPVAACMCFASRTILTAASCTAPCCASSATSSSFVGSGEAAVETVARNEHDVVLMDIALSGIDGIEATGASARCRRRPAAFRSSAYRPHRAARRRGREGGRHECYLRKPASPAELNEALRMAARINRA